MVGAPCGYHPGVLRPTPDHLAPGPSLLVDGRPVAPVEVARTRRARRVGLLGRPPSEAALLLERTRSVHGIGMSRALDVAQCDADGRILAVHRLRPGGLVLPRRGVRRVVEAEAGALASWGATVGSTLSVR